MNPRFLLIIISLIITSANATKITSIEYKGQKRIDKQTIASHFIIKEGDNIDDNDRNEALKALYKTGLFEDIKLKMSGSKLIVYVKEAPIIEKISFEGNKKLKDDDIKKYFVIKPRETLSLTKVKNIQIGLLETYRQIGMYNVTVNPKIIKLPNNKINLVFEIDETKPTKICKILFKGNKYIKTSELRRSISSRSRKWYRFMFQDDILSPERLKIDKEAIENYYKNHGYAEASVIDTTIELDDANRGFIITFTIDEGDLYTFGDIKIVSKIKRLKNQKLNKGTYCKNGELFDAQKVTNDAATIINNISKLGYGAINVDPEFIPDSKTKKIGINFNILETKKIYISKVVIKGNNRTRDYVILQELMLSEGDLYNNTLVAQSEANLQNTGFFQSVKIEKIPDPYVPDKCVMEITVEEKPTGQISAAFNYSKQDGPSINLAYAEQNFLGSGKGINLSFNGGRTLTGPSYGINDQGESIKLHRKAKFVPLSMTASLSTSHLLGTDITGTISGFRYLTSKYDSFQMQELGGSTSISYALGKNWSQSWEATIERRKITNVESMISPLIKAQLVKEKDGKFVLNDPLKYWQPSLQHSINFSKYLYRGLKGNYSIGLISSLLHNTNNKSFVLKNILSAAYMRPMGRSMALNFLLSTGWFNDISGKGVNIADAFTTSMTTFRGLDDGSASPKIMNIWGVKKNVDGKEIISDYKPSLDVTGAKNFIKTTVEFSFPVPGLPTELATRMFLFTDAGYYWNPAIPTKGYLNMEKDKFVTTKYQGENIDVPAATCSYDNNEADSQNRCLSGSKIIDIHKFRLTLGFGLKLQMPFGPLNIAFGFPVIKTIYDRKNTFIFGMSTVF